ncbi:S1 family peptidase [Mesorhizobium sp. 43Arga]
MPSEPTSQTPEDAAKDVSAERQATFDRRYRLLELKERRADRKLKREEISGALGRGFAFTPAQASVAAAIIALASGVVGGLIQGATSRDVEGEKSKGSLAIEKLKAEANIELEKQKFETTLILKATEAPRREDQIRNLKFFLNAGFISDPDGKIAKMDEASFPSLPPPTTTAPTPGDIFKHTRPSVGYLTFTYVDNAGAQAKRTSTCFIVSKDGFALTAAHAVSAPDDGNAGRAQLSVSLGDGQSRPATIVKVDANIDIALLKLPGEVEYNPLNLSKGERSPGDVVNLIGFGFQGILSMSTGNVASVDAGSGLIAIDTPMAPGQSGAPVLNAAGDVIGVVRGVRDGSTGLVVPIKLVQSLLSGIVAN